MAQELSRAELVRLVERIINIEGTEEEIDAMLDLLARSVPHPEVEALIYWNDQDLTAEQIVDKALRYEPIIVPGSEESSNGGQSQAPAT
ncbi:MAG: bacteriocin immunity protein [Anaerolineae bacterium]|nr:bacteriocin immunity protein [Anaerolineae bacterium]